MSTRIVFPSIGHSPAPSAASTSSQPAHNTLLSQIRNILNPGRPITKPKQAQSNRCLSVETDGGDYELEWDADTVTWKIGGIKRKTWKFDEDAVGKAEYVTTACFAWMDVNDIKTSAGSGSAKAPSASKPTTSTSSPKSSTFAPFAQLRFNQPSSSSTPFLGPKTTASTKRSRSSIGPLYSRCICIFLRHIGRIFTLDGYDYTINVPFAVQSAHPLLPVGILLHATLSDHDPTLPSLYTLTGPFAEFKAMGFATSIEGPVDTAPPGFPLLGPKPKIQPSKKHSIGWDETLLYVSPNGQCQDTREDSIIVTLDQSFCTLKVWRYVYVKTDTAPKPLRRKGAKAKAAAQTLGVGVTPLSAPPKSSKRKVAQTFDDPPLAPDDIFFMSPHTRHGSQTRNELSVTLDRMALGGTGEGEGTGLKGKGKAPMMNVGIEEESVPPEENASKGKMKADYWLEKLWEGEVDKDE
jgi:anaphase-promoting complex subunit 1